MRTITAAPLKWIGFVASAIAMCTGLLGARLSHAATQLPTDNSSNSLTTATASVLNTRQANALATSSIVSYSSPTGLIASTGNLYWTSKLYDEFGPDMSVVWRAGKNNVPGSEVVLYREYGDDRYFGDIVYANPGAFYGYFVANYQTAGGLISQIKRVPLTGGLATVIANSPSPVARDLITDGTRLFWVDNGGIRSVPLGGGLVTTLRGEGAYTTHLRLDSSYLVLQ